MEFYLNDCRNDLEVLCRDYESLSKLLNENFDHWNYENGDSCIRLSDSDDGIIFFKVELGIFIFDLSSMKAPLINLNGNVKIITHYIGGEPFEFPNVCLADEKTALKILCYAIENNGELFPEYDWIDFTEYVND